MRQGSLAPGQGACSTKATALPSTSLLCAQSVAWQVCLCGSPMLHRARSQGRRLTSCMTPGLACIVMAWTQHCCGTQTGLGVQGWGSMAGSCSLSVCCLLAAADAPTSRGLHCVLRSRVTMQPESLCSRVAAQPEALCNQSHCATRDTVQRSRCATESLCSRVAVPPESLCSRVTVQLCPVQMSQHIR